MKNSIKEVLQYILGGLIVIGFFVLMIVLTYKGIPHENKETFTLVVGALLTAFSIVVGYFYGSSLGSSKKNDILNKKE